jgi:hypothetical protein
MTIISYFFIYLILISFVDHVLYKIIIDNFGFPKFAILIEFYLTSFYSYYYDIIYSQVLLKKS